MIRRQDPTSADRTLGKVRRPSAEGMPHGWKQFFLLLFGNSTSRSPTHLEPQEKKGLWKSLSGAGGRFLKLAARSDTIAVTSQNLWHTWSKLRMSSPGSVTGWIAALKAGNQVAAQKLWERYYRRLVVLAHNKLRNRCRVADEEDVALSAFRWFLSRRGARPISATGRSRRSLAAASRYQHAQGLRLGEKRASQEAGWW